MTTHQNYRTAVMNIQRYLRSLSDGSEGSEIFSVPIDGIYESRTRDALSEFQRRYSLPITGISDKTTFDALFIEYQRRRSDRVRRSAPDFFPSQPPDYETEFGEKSSFISVLEFVLDELRVAYDTLPAFDMDGTFDGDTSLAVKEFQRIHYLPVTGRVNRATWNEMSRAYNSYVRYQR